MLCCKSFVSSQQILVRMDISVIVPLYNEEESLAELHEWIKRVMEKAMNVNVMSSDFGWSDLGTWSALQEQLKQDAENNVLVSPNGNAFVYKCSNSIISTPKDKVVVVEGLDNYIVAVTDDVVLICNKEEEQNIRQFVADVQIAK